MDVYLGNYRSPDIRTFPHLSIPPMEHVYLQRELTDRSEVSIEKGIQEMEIIGKHENLRELYSIQQSIYSNTAYLYRLLYDILSLLEKTFNQNSYIPSGGYYGDETDKHDEIWKSINHLLHNTFLVNSKNLHLNHINESLVKIHSILLELYDIMKCQRLFRPQFSKVKISFVSQIRQESDTLTPNVGVSDDTPV